MQPVTLETLTHPHNMMTPLLPFSLGLLPRVGIVLWLMICGSTTGRSYAPALNGVFDKLCGQGGGMSSVWICD